MINKVNIAVDAMGGENSPKKIIDGIELSLKENKENFFKLYGNKDQLNVLVNKKPEINNYCEIIHSENYIKDEESPLTAAKKSKSTSMWQSIESQKNGKSQITLSAGNTGALFILSRLILNMIDGIEKPALAGLWPNQIGMNVVLDLGANIECNDKNLIDFSYMGAALHKALYPEIEPKILAGKRRYYNNKEIRMIKLIKHLLKEKGMTIKGVKAVLNNPKSLTLDDTTKYSVSNQSLNKEKIKDKIKKISKIIDELKELKNG